MHAAAGQPARSRNLCTDPLQPSASRLGQSRTIHRRSPRHLDCCATHPARYFLVVDRGYRRLKLRNGRTSNNSNTRIFNGRAEYTVIQSALLDVTAPSTGTFTIPSFQLSVGGATYTAPAATLVVVENAEGELVFLDAALPEQLYLGQTTALELKLYLADACARHASAVMSCPQTAFPHRPNCPRRKGNPWSI